jgi:DeoR/GlpR family transcriptional regulator of sugar metabolism
MVLDTPGTAPASAVGQTSRSAELLALVRRRGRIEVSESARMLGVSQETVRRELRKLEAQGLVRRSYGLAFPVETSSFETALSERRDAWGRRARSSSTRGSSRCWRLGRCRTTGS